MEHSTSWGLSSHFIGWTFTWMTTLAMFRVLTWFKSSWKKTSTLEESSLHILLCFIDRMFYFIGATLAILRRSTWFHAFPWGDVPLWRLFCTLFYAIDVDIHLLRSYTCHFWVPLHILSLLWSPTLGGFWRLESRHWSFGIGHIPILIEASHFLGYIVGCLNMWMTICYFLYCWFINWKILFLYSFLG